MSEDLPPRYVLTLDCPDTTGIVAAVTSFLADHHATLVDAAHFNDEDTQRSFLRAVFHDDGRGMTAVPDMQAAFTSVAERFDMRWQLRDADAPLKTMIAVSTAGHCLVSMLHRWSTGSLPLDIVGIVSNHESLAQHAEWRDLPFHYLPITAGAEAEQESQLLSTFENSEAELLVLARYMRILSADACASLRGRCINIHHSFLPGFKGARPYHQAYARGVKIIGATAHYVTEDLDEGPIIEQAVERVDHTADAQELAHVGHDLESIVLNRSVRWHAEHRVFVNGNKTVIL